MCFSTLQSLDPYLFFQIQHFTNVEVKKGSAVGFHYDMFDNSKTVVAYTSTNGIGSRSLQEFGLNRGKVINDAGLPPGVIFSNSQLGQGTRIPMATFYVNSRGL